jgi:hypothetical protein
MPAGDDAAYSQDALLGWFIDLAMLVQLDQRIGHSPAPGKGIILESADQWFYGQFADMNQGPNLILSPAFEGGDKPLDRLGATDLTQRCGGSLA